MIESYSQKEIEEKIDQYVKGRLSHEEVDELWTELIQDEYYLDYLKSVANLKAVVEKRKSRARIVQLRKNWSYAAAAVVALVLGVLTVINYSGLTFDTEVKPISKIELDYYRSSEGIVDDSDVSRIIRDAITMANTGRFDEAVSLLENELNQIQDVNWASEIYLNLGSLFYNNGNYQKALSHFEKVLENSGKVDVLTLEKTYWYMGNAYFQLDQLDRAQSSIEKAYELNGAYRRVARSYLDALVK